MRAVIQRVKSASVSVDSKEISSIGNGIVILVGFMPNDTEEELIYLIQKAGKLRIFEDNSGKMNLSLEEINGEALFVSQFTLCSDLKKSGLRPSFSGAMPYDKAEHLYLRLLLLASEAGLNAKGGAYGSDMQLSLVNDGPVTFTLER